MNIQEREEMDFNMGMASDSQNAFALSQMEWDRHNDEPKIVALVKAGRFVVTHHETRYCPSTDAIMGADVYYCNDYATREEAEFEAGRLVFESCGSMEVYVRPYNDYVPPVVVDDSEIPF